MPLTLLPPPRPPGCPAHRLQIQPRLGDSILDMLEPVFALVATEVAWRVADPDRIISAEAVATVVTAGVRHACTYVCARDGNCCRGGCLWWMSARCGRCPHLFPSSPTASHHTHPPPHGGGHPPTPPPHAPSLAACSIVMVLAGAGRLQLQGKPQGHLRRVVSRQRAAAPHRQRPRVGGRLLPAVLGRGRAGGAGQAPCCASVAVPHDPARTPILLHAALTRATRRADQRMTHLADGPTHIH